MKPALKIDPAPWMRMCPVQKVLKALEDKSINGPSALFVGGCVRNWLLEEDVNDIDVATPLIPQVVTDRLEAAEITVVPTGIDHGTVTAVIDHTPIEITTLRKDVSTDGRRATVAFTTDWMEDAQRRDFTMNTLLADSKGNVYDPTGKGLEDLKQRRVVFVGEAAGRIAEDYLRILRFFRFNTYYGDGMVDKKALAACASAAGQIKTLSRERITAEYFKILAHPECAWALQLMAENGVLTDLAHPDFDLETLEFFAGTQDEVHIMPRLLILCGFHAEHVRALERYLIFSNAQKKELKTLFAAYDFLEQSDEARVKESIYRFGHYATEMGLLLRLASLHTMPDSKLMKLIATWEAPTFPVTGQDLIKQGYEQGPDLGQKLAELEAQWIENGFTLDGN